MSESGFRGTQKKVWSFVTAVPDHTPGQYVCIQELDGHWEEPDFDTYGPEDDGWRDAVKPAPTRVVLMKMENGAMRNVHSSPYNGDKYSQR